MLGFLGVLPLVWWLLRLTPPAPRKVAFPALELLRGLAAREEVPAQTPWWLLILRLAILALAILAFAQPQLNPPPKTATPNSAPPHSIALLVIDNDWASARDWSARQKAMLDQLQQTENQSFMILPTARGPDDAPIAIIGPLDALSAQTEIRRLAPQPWPADWKGATATLKNVTVNLDAIAWLASGTGGADAQIFYKGLQEKTSHMRAQETGTPIQLLRPPQREDNATILNVLRLDPVGASLRGAVIAFAQDGRALARLPYAFAEGSTRAIATLDAPTELRNSIASFALEGQRGAGAVILLDSGWTTRDIGIVGDEGEGERRTLLSGVYYLQRALSPYATLRYGALPDLLKQNPAMIVLPETAEPAEAELKPLQEWIAHGGILLRFAGTRLSSSIPSHAQSELLPVPLRVGGRAMGGTLSWDKPKKLGAFPQSSPFAGLSIPDEVTVSRQILAEPSPALAAHTWAALEDGTPLVTAKKIGQGQTILFHVPARPDGSNLPLSGVFVSMLRRIVEQTQTGSMAEERKTEPLRQSESYAPLRVLDGFGETQSPDAAALAVPENDWPSLQPSPRHPPGLYGKGNVTRAFNLGSEGNKLLESPQGIPFRTIQNAEKSSQSQTIELKPWILSLAMALMLLDFAITLWLRGLAPVRGMRKKSCV